MFARPAARPVAVEVGRGGGFGVMFSDRLLRVLVPGLWAFVIVAEAVNVVEVPLVTGGLGLSASGYGLVLAVQVAVQGGGGVQGAWAAGRLHRDRAGPGWCSPGPR